MGGGPPSRIPPYIGVVYKKRGDNPVKEILGKNYWEVGVPLEHPHTMWDNFPFGNILYGWGTYGNKKYRSGT